jgi:hypothetical protein
VPDRRRTRRLLLAGLLFLPGHRPARTVLVICVVWYVMFAGIQLWFARRLRARQRQVLSTVDGAAG